MKICVYINELDLIIGEKHKLTFLRSFSQHRTYTCTAGQNLCCNMYKYEGNWML